MIIAIASLVAVLVIAFIVGVRQKDLPEPVPESPFQHLDERKNAIYENLRDLQFEYRLGKLSDDDYQHTKRDLQKELARVMADIDTLREKLTAGGSLPVAAAPAPPVKKPIGFVCPSCNASFKEDLKFCGECGKPMKVEVRS